MIIANVTLSDLQQATKEVGDIRMEAYECSTRNQKRFRVRLFPVGDARRAYTLNPDGKGSVKRRRVNAVSWLGYRDWFRALYSWAPNAEIRTGYKVAAVYRSLWELEVTHRETGYVNIGSRALPLLAHHNQWPGPANPADPHMDRAPV